MTEEVRVVNSITGGEKGSKLERFDLIPVTPLTKVARHYGVGAKKYADRNWERGYDWSLSFAAMMRHAWQFWNGEDIDEETGSPHLAAVVFHALALMEFADTHPELDNRPVHGETVDLVEALDSMTGIPDILKGMKTLTETFRVPTPNGTVIVDSGSKYVLGVDHAADIAAGAENWTCGGQNLPEEERLTAEVVPVVDALKVANAPTVLASSPFDVQEHTHCASYEGDPCWRNPCHDCDINEVPYEERGVEHG